MILSLLVCILIVQPVRANKNAGNYATPSCTNVDYDTAGPTSTAMCPPGMMCPGCTGFHHGPGCSASTFAIHQCSPGQYSVAGAGRCAECTAGSWSGARFALCLPCPPGTYSAAGASACIACSPGTFSSGGTGSCTSCPVGTFSTSNASIVCTACPPGTASPGGKSSCEPCAPSTFAAGPGNGRCELCPPGTFSATNTSTLCTPCPPGTASPGGKSSCEPCSCSEYASGTGNAVCVDCPAHKYSDAQSDLCPFTLARTGLFCSTHRGSTLTISIPADNTTSNATFYVESLSPGSRQLTVRHGSLNGRLRLFGSDSAADSRASAHSNEIATLNALFRHLFDFNVTRIGYDFVGSASDDFTSPSSSLLLYGAGDLSLFALPESSFCSSFAVCHPLEIKIENETNPSTTASIKTCVETSWFCGDLRSVEWSGQPYSAVRPHFAALGRHVPLSSMVSDASSSSSSIIKQDACSPSCPLPCAAATVGATDSCESLANQTILSFVYATVVAGDPALAERLYTSAASAPNANCSAMRAVADLTRQPAKMEFACDATRRASWFLVSSSSSSSEEKKKHLLFVDITQLEGYSELFGVNLRCTTCAPYFVADNVSLPIVLMALGALKTLILVVFLNWVDRRFHVPIGTVTAWVVASFVNALTTSAWQSSEEAATHARVKAYFVTPRFSQQNLVDRLRPFVQAPEALYAAPPVAVAADTADEARTTVSSNLQRQGASSAMSAASSSTDDMSDDLMCFATEFARTASWDGERVPKAADDAVWKSTARSSDDGGGDDLRQEHRKLLESFVLAFNKHKSVVNDVHATATLSEAGSLLATDELRSLASQVEDDTEQRTPLLKQQQRDDNTAGKQLQDATDAYNIFAGAQPQLFERVDIEHISAVQQLIPNEVAIFFDLCYTLVLFSVSLHEALTSCSLTHWQCFQSMYFRIFNSTSTSAAIVNISACLLGKNVRRSFDRYVAFILALLVAPGFLTHCLPGLVAYIWLIIGVVLVCGPLYFKFVYREAAPVWALAVLRVASLFAVSVALSMSFNVACIFIYANGTGLGDGVRPSYIDALTLEYQWRSLSCIVDEFLRSLPAALRNLASVGPTPV